MPARDNGFDKDIERAREAGRNNKRGIDFKGMLRLILNEKLPIEVFEKLKTQLGIEENISQGETALRSIALKTIQRGDSKQMIDVLKIIGEYTEVIKHEGEVKNVHNISEETLDKLGDIFIQEFGKMGPT